MDKLQKVLNEVERLQNELIKEKKKGNGSDVDDACILTLQNIKNYIKFVQEEPVSERFAFKAIPRLLEMIEPTDRAKSYIAKLANTLELEGYSTDAKIVRESLKIMNGEKVAMATMDKEPISEDLISVAKQYVDSHVFGNEEDKFTRSVLVDMFCSGANWKEQQMIAKAIDGKVIANGMGKPILHLWDKGKHLIDKKVKVIVIEEE